MAVSVYVGLIAMAMRMKHRWSAILWGLALILTLGMGGIAGGSEMTIPMQWVAESVNSTIYVLFFIASTIYIKFTNSCVDTSG